MRWGIYFVALTLAVCHKPAVLAPASSPVPVEEKATISGSVDTGGDQPDKKTTQIPQQEAEKPVIELPSAPELTRAGFLLITEFEGWAARPELPDLRYSGVSWGYGYDAHQNSKVNILSDWQALPEPQPARLAATQPFYGRSAIQANKDVHDVVIPHSIGDDVFLRVDMSKVYGQCRKVMPGFDDLRLNAQSAIASLIFNRGSGMSGPNRVELRAIKLAVIDRNYEEIAIQMRKMVRIWVGTEIESGMRRRRYAEAALVMTP